MYKDKVTRNDLRGIKPGETVTYELPSDAKVNSVRSMAAYLGKSEGIALSVSVKDAKNVVTVTRIK